jgi:AbrB family looped-hinge helix DNA binding protein
MAHVVLTSKGQMTLPKDIRDDLEVGPGDRLEITKQGDGYLLTRKRPARELFAKFRSPHRRTLTVEEMDQAIEEEVWERNRPKHDRN